MEAISMKINVVARDWYGWNHSIIGKFNIWFNGYILNMDIDLFLSKGLELLENDSSANSEFDDWLRKAQGHFSFIIANHERLIFSVDHVRSIPLFYSINNNEIKVGNYAPDIAKAIDSKDEKYNQQAALEISMSGYTIGRKTLHPEISQLTAGRFLLVRGGKLEESQYYRYSPWKVKKRVKSQLKKELTEISRQVLEDMVKDADGRQLVIPLSAGNDSRFIASGLKELGVRNVYCFSYGISNNFEVKTAQQVASHLGFPWQYIPLSIAIQKRAFSELKFEDFWKFTDTLSNNPVLIDYSAVKLLKESGKISKDAIFINGNSGDFITGGHIPPINLNGSISNIEQLIRSIFNKHYSLWDCLKSEGNVNKIQSELENSIINLIDDYNLTLDDLPEIAESIEWYGRQSKIVTTTQRSYEFHGYEWRLPMWDPIYMDFWEGVERKYKLNQSIYIETLIENNWGGVWKDMKVNNFSIASDKLRLFRNILKLFFVLFGKNAWHRFDKRCFAYFYDVTAATAIVPYNKVFFDKGGYRNRNSWIVKKYLADKGIDPFNQKFSHKYEK